MSALIDIRARVPGHQRPGELPVVALARHRRGGEVEIKYQAHVDRSRYAGAKLRAIRADGEHR